MTYGPNYLQSLVSAITLIWSRVTVTIQHSSVSYSRTCFDSDRTSYRLWSKHEMKLSSALCPYSSFCSLASFILLVSLLSVLHWHCRLTVLDLSWFSLSISISCQKKSEPVPSTTGPIFSENENEPGTGILTAKLCTIACTCSITMHLFLLCLPTRNV